MTELKNYVLCVAMPDEDHVVMIRKERPEWQAGRFNFPGGKIRYGETAHEASVREYYEETGVITKLEDWKQFGYISGQDWGVVVMQCPIDPKHNDAKTQTDEEISIHSIDFHFMNENPLVPFVETILHMYRNRVISFRVHGG